MEKTNIYEINKFFKEFQSIGEVYKKNIGKGLSFINSSKTSLITKKIPELLYGLFPQKTYKIKGSIGQGRITKCPWIAIMNKNVTTSTQEGVYLVFLFSGDLKRLYFQLGQGVTKTPEKTIISRREEIRQKLDLENHYLIHLNDQQIDDEKYKKCAIYAVQWNNDDPSYCEQLLIEYKTAYEKYVDTYMKKEISKKHVIRNSGVPSIKTCSVDFLNKKIQSSGLIYSGTIIKRLAFSLMAKPFVILSGLAGSGKTQLALAFAKCLSESIEEQVCIVSIGADWTNREPLLGYPNALKNGEYVMPESGVLQLLIRANADPSRPYFLILDEMNLSLVERYFADFLSVMESGENIKLWDDEGNAPKEIALPKNVFIIGTINVDETTYMFSPKVLDRANVIEFKIAPDEMEKYLDEKKDIHLEVAYTACADLAEDFVNKAKSQIKIDNQNEKTILLSFFKELRKVNAEFGYRTINEICRFLYFAHKDENGLNDNEAIDIAILQKLLPKLHGSRKKLVPVLSSMWKLCLKNNKDSSIDSEFNQDNFIYPESAEKIQRMYNAVVDNGFTSFAEA